MIRETKFYEELGGIIRSARNQLGLTQEELARLVSLTRTSITNIEKGRQKVSSHLLVELSEVLNFSLANLPQVRDEHARLFQAMPAPVRKWIEEGTSPNNLT